MTTEPQNPYASEASVPLRGFAYYLDHLYGLPGVLAHKVNAGSRLAWRGLRVALITAGLPVERPCMVLSCPGGNDASGFFAEFGSVLGMLDHYDRWKYLYAGVRVDFRDQGLYYDPARGLNWWSYYFEPLAAGAPGAAPESNIPDRLHDVYAVRTQNTLPRARGRELIERYIRIRQEISAKVDEFAQSEFGGCFVIGVHYRGTDKIKESPRVAYSEACASIREAVHRHAAGRLRLYVATDEQPFLDLMRQSFPELICHRHTIRSTDGRRIHDSDLHSYRKGEEALIDCLLLSRCNLLLRTESNLSLCATFFNPEMPQILLSADR